MSRIILDEKEAAQKAIEMRQLGSRPSETLSRVARYYRQCEGYKRKEVREKLDDFLLQCDPNANLASWSPALDSMSKNANKQKLIKVDSIYIYADELAKIKTLDLKQEQRVAFSLLCISKYWDAVNPKNNGWTNISEADLMRMSNVVATAEKRCRILRNLRDKGLIAFSKRIDNLNLQVTFSSKDGAVIIPITDFRNLGNQYSMYYGESFIHCQHCGLVVRKKSNRHKYCAECASEIYVKQSVESVTKLRDGKTSRYAT